MVKDGNLSLEELYEHANRLCMEHWGITYTGRIELVSRNWAARNGCFIYDRGTEERFIRMSKKRNSGRKKEEVLATLLHELVHWRLHSQGLPARDSDEEFVRECLRVGASISLTQAAQDAVKRFKEEAEKAAEAKAMIES
ncbi:hypothetical protein ACFPU1_11175 [Thalassorhabdus alkalitolerans]|uniref:SprT-like family protein n=1 Tax=Thalassorhabdus alkalitolerans TaxID=2282697 RepID=A0ABW0YLT3_9BACI|nr:hypothetical protein [Thalassobacillus sp. C254]